MVVMKYWHIETARRGRWVALLTGRRGDGFLHNLPAVVDIDRDGVGRALEIGLVSAVAGDSDGCCCAREREVATMVVIGRLGQANIYTVGKERRIGLRRLLWMWRLHDNRRNMLLAATAQHDEK